MIDADKDVEYECANCKEKFCNMDSMPPCASEKGSFLSPFEYHRTFDHSYKRYGNKLFKDFLPAKFTSKPFSFNAVPFRWMLKDSRDNSSEMAEIYNLSYDSNKEETLCDKLGFRPNWVQDRDNQRELLDSFFGCLEPRKSLVFFYARHTPLSEVGKRVLIGAAYITNVGNIIDFEYPKGYSGHRAYVWDRLISHSLCNPDDGCIIPYHELIQHETDNPDDSYACRECVAGVPEYEQFSHASELVENDVAIDSLFAIQESLRKVSIILKTNFSKQLEWLDDAISCVWNMRGAFPSMGSVLTAMQFTNGNSIAWCIDQYIIDTFGDIYGADAWEVFDKAISGKIEIPGIKITPTMRTQWSRAISDNDKLRMRLLSRIQMNNEQAEYALNIEGALENPFVLFETSRRDAVQISFNAIDKAIYSPSIIFDKFPLTETKAFDDNLDTRRIRALVLSILEESADKGDTLMVEGDLINASSSMVLSAPAPLTGQLLESYCMEDSFSDLVVRIVDEDNKAIFYKLKRLAKIKSTILTRINFSIIEKRTLSCEGNFRKYLDNAIGIPYDPKDKVDAQSRKEKEEAMAVLARYRVSVLVGPAGSGKTTLLKAFCSIPQIESKGIVMLAPTGKARVNMSERAETVAQFLYRHNRYDIFTGQYRLNPDAGRSTCGTLIIDEASMLTEEQLASVLDAVTYERMILVGDYRQLPPIGAGRPFFDIVQQLKPLNGFVGTGYAELTNVSRQKQNNGNIRNDITLSRFFGNPHKFDYENIFVLLDNISSNPTNEIQLIRWDTNDKLQKVLMEALKEHLQLDDDDLTGSFEDKALGRTSGIFFNYDSSEYVIENWQIISPINGHAFGVKEINKTIQQKFRKKVIEQAMRRWSAIPEPQGRDNFVYGDKVINLGNRTLREKAVIQRGTKRSLNYMANGEIGCVVGQYKGKGKQGKPNVWIAFSSQPGYAYSFKQGSFDEGERTYEFELAYCISVHKSQGSGFGSVFLILPANNPLLSRELLYTALTRQKDKIIILHQGNFSGYLKYSSDEYSETARRLTDLFMLPNIKKYKNKHYDFRYVNITQKGEPVISKSEVIIANILYSYEQKGMLTYSYENKLELSTGRIVKPDFTIEDLRTGRKFYWEHLGLLSSQEYKDKWELKRKAYLADGIVPAEEATMNDDIVLITSEDLPQGGLNSQSVENKIKEFIFYYD
jgi:GTPase SAR1 family protein